MLKECAEEISPSLTKLFNKSLRTGIIPAEWKLANIISLFKNGTNGHLENYRPISLLSLISNFPLMSPRIHKDQHGFSPGKSCTTQLLSTFDDIGMKLDRGEVVDILYTVMSKAFDQVDHYLLLAQLQRIGLTTLDLKMAVFIYPTPSTSDSIGNDVKPTYCSIWSPARLYTRSYPVSYVHAPVIYCRHVSEVLCTQTI